MVGHVFIYSSLMLYFISLLYFPFSLEPSLWYLEGVVCFSPLATGCQEVQARSQQLKGTPSWSHNLTAESALFPEGKMCQRPGIRFIWGEFVVGNVVFGDQCPSGVTNHARLTVFGGVWRNMEDVSYIQSLYSRQVVFVVCKTETSWPWWVSAVFAAQLLSKLIAFSLNFNPLVVCTPLHFEHLFKVKVVNFLVLMHRYK